MAKTISISFPTIQDIKMKNWSFSKSRDFEQTISRTVLGGAAAGFLAVVIGFVFGNLGFENFVGLVFVTSAFATVFKTKAWMKSILAGGLGLFAAWIFFNLYNGQWPWFTATLSGIILAPVFAKGHGLRRILGTGLMTGLAIFAGYYTTHVMQSQAILSGLVPNILAQMVYGGIFGLFLGLGSSALHIQRKTNSLQARFKAALEATCNSELTKLLERTDGLYQLIIAEFQRQESPAHPEIEIQVEALGTRVLKLSGQCSGLQDDLQLAHIEDLSQRISDIRQKSDQTKDVAAQQTLREAVDNLEEQRLALGAIETSHDRILARIHADVALLERLRFALLQLRNSHEQNLEEHGFELNLSLEAISQEIEATCSVVDEVYAAPMTHAQSQTAKTQVQLRDDAVSPEIMLFRKTA